MRRFLIVSSAILGVVILSWVVLIGAIYAWGGVATVRVQDPGEGVNLFVPVPMALVNAAVTTSTWVVPEEEWIGLRLELGEWGPMLDELIAELDDLPDVTLVEVEDGTTHVRVHKQGGSLRVAVEDGEVRVRVALPLSSARYALSKVAGVI